jgi:hypothetical protein
VILPTKHLPTDCSLLAGGAAVLSTLGRPATVSVLWERVRAHPALTTFDRFVLAVDFLFALGLVSWQRGRLVRVAA